jgi:hypothetical protein
LENDDQPGGGIGQPSDHRFRSPGVSNKGAGQEDCGSFAVSVERRVGSDLLPRSAEGSNGVLRTEVSKNEQGKWFLRVRDRLF